MPSDQENVKYLYQVLTSGGTPIIDWAKVSQDLSITHGATTKRWSRLRQALEKGTSVGPTAYQFLWHCVKHSSREKAINWALIAKECDTTAGAASKRYSRMKQAFDSGAPGPSASATTSPSPAKRKATAASYSDNVFDTIAPSKRFRTPAGGKKVDINTPRAELAKAMAAVELTAPEGNEQEEKNAGKANGKAKTRARAKAKPVSKLNLHDKGKGKAEVKVESEAEQVLPPSATFSLVPTDATTFIKSPDLVFGPAARAAALAKAEDDGENSKDDGQIDFYNAEGGPGGLVYERIENWLDVIAPQV